MPDLTVAELILCLQQMPQGDVVRVWLPGSRISLGAVFKHEGQGETLIEGNVVPGSALDPR